jgi:hypothetical protein
MWSAEMQPQAGGQAVRTATPRSAPTNLPVITTPSLTSPSARLQREKKEEGKDKKAADKALLKEERMLHDTRRAHTDARHQAKKEEKKESGATCEHGVWKCRICYPVGDHR